MSQDITQFEWYQMLNGKVSPDILHSKNSSNNYLWNDIHLLNIKYLAKNVANFPWINHFALAVLSTTDRKLNAISINNMISSLHARFRDVFEAYELKTVHELRDRHIIGLINSEICFTLTDRQRSNFVSHYKTFYYNISKWIREKLTEEELQNISSYVLPEFAFDHNDFKVRQQAIDKAHKKRKDQTSAIAPLLPSIRAEAHFRWNQIKRLREITIKMIKQVESGIQTLPLNFSYTESEFLNEKLYFTLYRTLGLKKPNRTEEEIVDTHYYHIEFIKAESLIDNSPGEGLWFFEIIQNRFLGAWSNLCSLERKKEGELFFESRGYDLLETMHPFQSRNKGVLTQGFQLTRQNNLLDTSNFLINIEPIFIACMFGMFAIDVQCSSGARLNELLQISYDKECCIITEDKSIVPTKKSYIFRLIPKGRIIEENYYMPEIIFKSLAFIVEELRNHYGSKHLPTVSYSVNARKELIKDRKFIFQYERAHINNFTLNAIIRFLTHGLSIETQEGKPVILTTHLLRHAFATHAAQTEKLPIDIIRQVLHQRDESVTEYYSAPTGQQISSLLDTMHENWASYIDIQKEVVRGPEELQEIYQEYKENVGTVSKVVGGVCTIDSVCPTKMACMGCAAKVPQPEFKHEIQNVYDWAEESEKRFRGLGLEVEVRKMKIIKKRAKIELKEIHLIEQFEKDEYYEPNIEVD